MSIVEFFCITNELFDTLVMYPKRQKRCLLVVHTLYFRLNIQNYLEDKKSLFRKLYMSLTLTLRSWLRDICDTVRYKDVADRLATAPTIAIDADATLDIDSMAVVALTAYQRPRCLRQVLRPHQPQVLVLRRADRSRPCTTPCRRYHVVITAGSRLTTYIISEIKIFYLLDGFGY